jgi:hypothetical protein
VDGDGGFEGAITLAVKQGRIAILVGGSKSSLPSRLKSAITTPSAPVLSPGREVG